MEFLLLIFLIDKSFGYFDIRYEVRLASWNTGRMPFLKLGTFLVIQKIKCIYKFESIRVFSIIENVFLK